MVDFTDAINVAVGDAILSSHTDNLADNTEFNREYADFEHNFDISTADGTHKDITALSGTFNTALADKNFIVGTVGFARALFVDGTNGNVGLGSSTTPHYKFTLGSSSDKIGWYSNVDLYSSALFGGDYILWDHKSAGAGAYVWQAAAVDIMTLSSAGNLVVSGTLGAGATTVTDFQSTGNTTIGNATGDALTFHPSAWTLTNAVSITGTWTDLGTVTTADINGGTLDGVTIGGATPAAATVTTLQANDTITATKAGSGAITTPLRLYNNVDAIGTGVSLPFLAPFTKNAIVVESTASYGRGAFQFWVDNAADVGPVAAGDLVATIDYQGFNGVLGATTPAAATVTTFTSTGIDDNASATALTIDASGNLGLGVTPQATGSGFTSMSLGGNGYLIANTAAGAGGEIDIAQNGYWDGSNWTKISDDEASRYNQINGTHVFSVEGSGTGTITWDNVLTIANNGRFDQYVDNTDHSFKINAVNATPYGLHINFSGATPNNTTSTWIYCNDATNDKFIVYSDGSVQGRANSYGGISDVALKTNITPARDYWDDWKKLKYSKWQWTNEYEEQGDEAKKLFGIVAQDLAEVFPGCTYDTDEGLAVRTSVVNTIGGRVLQRAQERIEDCEGAIMTSHMEYKERCDKLEARVAELEAKLAA